MKRIVLISSILLAGCGGCLKGFYGVHEPPKSLDYEFVTTLSKSEMFSKIESLNSKNYDSLKCRYPELTFDSTVARIVHLEECQSFFVVVEDNKIRVEGAYIRAIGGHAWLLAKHQIDEDLEQHIKQTAHKFIAE